MEERGKEKLKKNNKMGQGQRGGDEMPEYMSAVMKVERNFNI